MLLEYHNIRWATCLYQTLLKSIVSYCLCRVYQMIRFSFSKDVPLEGICLHRQLTRAHVCICYIHKKPLSMFLLLSHSSASLRSQCGQCHLMTDSPSSENSQNVHTIPSFIPLQMTLHFSPEDINPFITNPSQAKDTLSSVWEKDPLQPQCFLFFLWFRGKLPAVSQLMFIWL